MGQWFWVVFVERFVRQSRQMRCVQGKFFGRVSEDQQTMQVGSSSSSSSLLAGEEDGVGSVDDCSMGGFSVFNGSVDVCSVAGCSVALVWFASDRFFMNLSKLGRLPAVFD